MNYTHASEYRMHMREEIFANFMIAYRLSTKFSSSKVAIITIGSKLYKLTEKLYTNP